MLDSIDFFFFFSSRRRHTRLQGDWSSDVCSSDLTTLQRAVELFQQKNAREFVSKGQRRERPLDGRAIFHFTGKTCVITNHEREPVWVRRHMLFDEFRKLFGGPGFAVWIEYDNAIRSVQYG